MNNNIGGDNANKEMALTYFSSMITAMAFLPIFTDFILSRLPACSSGTCSDIEIVYLSSGKNYLILFAFISFSIMWLLLGRVRIYFLPEEKYWVDVVLPPKNDTLPAMVIIATSLTVFFVVSAVSAIFIFFPEFSVSLFIKIFENQVSYIVGTVFILISAIFGGYKKFNVSLFFLVGGFLYFLTALFA